MDGLKRWMELCPGEAYNCTLGPKRELFLFKEENDRWTLWWGQWNELHGEKPASEKTLASGLTFEQALERGNSYLDWWFERKGKRGK